MLKRKLPLVLAALCVLQFSLISPCHATDVYIPDKFKGIILYAPGPVQYSNPGKIGLYRLKINPKTGLVEEVAVLKPVNHFVDPVAVLAFMNWKVKPRTLKRLDVPVRWDKQATVLLKDAGSE